MELTDNQKTDLLFIKLNSPKLECAYMGIVQLGLLYNVANKENKILLTKSIEELKNQLNLKLNEKLRYI